MLTAYVKKNKKINHYLIECAKYENVREKMRKILFDCCRILHLDVNMLLEAKQEEDFKEWRGCILSELEDYKILSYI